MGSACAPRTTRRTPILGCTVTFEQVLEEGGAPDRRGGALGEPMRLEAPPERDYGWLACLFISRLPLSARASSSLRDWILTIRCAHPATIVLGLLKIYAGPSRPFVCCRETGGKPCLPSKTGTGCSRAPYKSFSRRFTAWRWLDSNLFVGGVMARCGRTGD